MKLITWNIQWGLGMDGRCDLGRIVSEAKRIADFDVLCLQEVADNFPELREQGGANQFAALSAMLPAYSAIEGIAVDIPAPDRRRQRFGNLILTRYPVEQVIRHTLPWEADDNRSMPRVLIEATLKAPFGPVRVMTTHLEYYSTKQRAAQVAGIRDVHRQACARVATPPRPAEGTTFRPHPTTRSAILTADFNMETSDPSYPALLAPFPGGEPRFVDAWRATDGDAPHPHSFCIYDQKYKHAHCCDFVLVTDDLVPRLRRTFYDVKTQASDHQPVLVELDDG